MVSFMLKDGINCTTKRMWTNHRSSYIKIHKQMYETEIWTKYQKNLYVFEISATDTYLSIRQTLISSSIINDAANIALASLTTEFVPLVCYTA